MSLENGFLLRDNKIFDISKKKIIIGIFLFVTVAFSGYFLLQFIREYFRIFSGTLFNNNLPVFTKEITNFYNFFFAFIASISAQSLVFVYWYERPKFLLSRYNYKRTVFYHEHRFTIWYFLNWFAKIGLVIGILFLNLLIQDLHRDLSYIFYLFALVLFLQVWTSFRLYLKKKSIKWIVLSFLILVSYSFILSNINIINYNKINQEILKSNPYYEYNIHIPKSKDLQSIFDRTLYHDLFLIPKKSNNDSLNILLINKIAPMSKKVITISDFDSEFQLTKSFTENNRVYFKFHADKKTKMRDINQLKDKLSQFGFYLISYAVRTEDIEESTPIYYILDIGIPHVIINATNKKDFLTNYPINIKLNADLDLFIDNLKSDNLSFEKILKFKIQSNPKYSIVFQYSNERTYEEYLKVIEKINVVIQTLNEEDKKLQLGPNPDFVIELNYKKKYYPFIIESTI